MISENCQVAESTSGDLGGGTWAGQLLDDCDSEDGASGGGLVASTRSGHYLVGIRSGAHWDPEVFPPGEYPLGPPAGATWDILRNTNFSRAIDLPIIEALRAMVQDLGKDTAIDEYL